MPGCYLFSIPDKSVACSEISGQIQSRLNFPSAECPTPPPDGRPGKIPEKFSFFLDTRESCAILAVIRFTISWIQPGQNNIREQKERKRRVKNLSGKTIERLSIYRRLLAAMAADGTAKVYSHHLAEKSGSSAAQVRRDLMEIGCSGNTKKGYDIDELIEAIGKVLDNPSGEPVVLVGLGNLGRALLPFFAAHHPKLKIVAAFDADPAKTGRVIHGCRSHPIEELKRIVSEEGIRVAILTVPAAAAQEVAEDLVAAGVRGILNFAPATLRLPEEVSIESMDMASALEKIAYLARRGISLKGKGRES